MTNLELMKKIKEMMGSVAQIGNSFESIECSWKCDGSCWEGDYEKFYVIKAKKFDKLMKEMEENRAKLIGFHENQGSKSFEFTFTLEGEEGKKMFSFLMGERE